MLQDAAPVVRAGDGPRHGSEPGAEVAGDQAGQGAVVVHLGVVRV